jgi:hypothetical protein
LAFLSCDANKKTSSHGMLIVGKIRSHNVHSESVQICELHILLMHMFEAIPGYKFGARGMVIFGLTTEVFMAHHGSFFHRVCTSKGLNGSWLQVFARRAIARIFTSDSLSVEFNIFKFNQIQLKVDYYSSAQSFSRLRHIGCVSWFEIPLAWLHCGELGLPISRHQLEDIQPWRFDFRSILFLCPQYARCKFILRNYLNHRVFRSKSLKRFVATDLGLVGW